MCDPFPRRSLAEKTPPGPAPTKLDHWGLENGRHLRSSTRREERGSSNRWWPTSRWTNRCSRRCCKKRSEARPAARSGPAPARGLSRERPTGLRRGRMPARDVLLPRQASRSDPAADAAARVGGGAAAVRLSTALHPAPTVGVARVNHKRIYRLYGEEQLAVRRRRRKKRASHLRVVPPRPTRPNEQWCMDFMAAGSRTVGGSAS